ncbi:restriction endonuclease subunit S [Vibrio parahaemolyticus]|nr:restriction endonuclease subunit S [Vibrio parahaemolyticus]EJC6812415.1 restriction endonuclease subunit S [Vibrio parahaemolyticus]EJC6927211.1 restriction endonuclease subunit S [Vibrio parahaemolyticus]EJC6941216.1 restriction endonuclease subunit S [Vibrio parahaemolyticus]EJC6974399.1 restriction endonuclease subunit S [Vibrio parahaemolyticus]
MSIEKNVPEIRFEGFKGQWSEFSLGELGSVATNKRIFMHQTSSIGEVPFFKIGTFGKEPQLFISLDLFEDYKKRFPFPNKGDLLFSVIGSIGRVVEYTGENQYFQDSNIVWLKHDGTIVNSFLKQFYSIVEWSGLEGSTIKHLYNRNILETKIKMPSPKEQTQIGNYFQKLDNLINQHQQKHAKLRNIKKAMLEKMFPKQGETIPEIRFKGFSGEWEESSLAEEAVVTTGYPFDSADFSEDGDLLVVTNGNIQNSSSAVDGKVGNRIASEKVTHLNQYKLNFGDILVTMDGSVGRTAKVIDRNQILAQRVGRLVARNDTEFLYQSLNTGAFLETMTTISHGGTIKHISLSEIGSYIVHVPKDLNEQAKIGAYLKKLDDLIERHHKQITKLNNIKQACLSKMFV